MADRFVRWTLRCAALPVAALLWLLVTQASLGNPPSFELLLYGSCAALLAACVLSALLALLAAIDARWLSHQRWIACLLVLALAYVPARALGLSLSEADGLRARGYSPRWLALGFTCFVLSLPLLTWAYQRIAAPRVRDLVLGLLLAGALSVLDLRFVRHNPELAALIELCLLCVVASWLELCSARSKGLRLLLLALSGAVLFLAAASLMFTDALAEGRRRARLTESSIDYLDGELSTQLSGLLSSEPPQEAVCPSAPQSEVWPALPQTVGRQRNVVLISIDTLRADRAHARMDGRAVMPELQRFMSESQAAAHAYAAFPATAMSLRAAFSGLSSSELLLAAPPGDNLFTWSRDLVQARVALVPRGNYFQRPDVVQTLLRDLEVRPASGATAQTDEAIELLRGLRASGRNHLVWVHYFEPHEPYITHAGLDYGSAEDQRYASELSHVDAHLGRLLQVLRAEGWYDDSLIVLFSDHGESFGERGHRGHHQLLYPWLIEVPFALHAPGTAPGVFSGPVHLMDIAPTALHFLGRTEPPRFMRGSSLLAPGAIAKRTLFSEAFPITGAVSVSFAQRPPGGRSELAQRRARIERGNGYPSKVAVLRDGYQLIVHRGSGAAELYNLERDPRAEHDLFHREPEKRLQLQRAYAAFREQVWNQAACRLPGAGRPLATQ